MDKNKRKLIKDLFKGLKKYNNDRIMKNIVNEKNEKYSKNDRGLYKDDDLMFLLYDKLDKNEKRYIDLTFRYDLSVYEVIERLYISESTYYRNMRKIYMKLIRYMEKFESLFEN